MAFGFPPFHKETVTALVTGDELAAAIEVARKCLGWASKPATHAWVFSSSLNILSWGERVEILDLGGGQLELHSQCAMVTQCFDYGRNRGNIIKLKNELAQAGVISGS